MIQNAYCTSSHQKVGGDFLSLYLSFWLEFEHDGRISHMECLAANTSTSMLEFVTHRFVDYAGGLNSNSKAIRGQVHDHHFQEKHFSLPRMQPETGNPLASFLCNGERLSFTTHKAL